MKTPITAPALELTPAQADRRRLWLFLYLTFNIIGLFMFGLAVGGIESDAKLEERDYYDFGDSLRFILFGLPPMSFCVLLNLFWAVKAITDVVKRRSHSALMTVLAVLAAWHVVIALLGLKIWCFVTAPFELIRLFI